MDSKTPKLTDEEARLIMKTQSQLETGLRIAGLILSEEEIALVIKRSFERERVLLIQHFL